MLTNDTASIATLSPEAWRRLAMWLADRRGVEVASEALDTSIRRAAASPRGDLHDRAATLLESIGVGTVLVARSLDDVISDASTRRAWVAFATATGQCMPVAILGRRWGRVLVC